MRTLIERQLDAFGKWNGFYRFIHFDSYYFPFIVYDLSFSEAYFKYSTTLGIIDASGDMINYKDVGKIRVPARSKRC